MYTTISHFTILTIVFVATLTNGIPTTTYPSLSEISQTPQSDSPSGTNHNTGVLALTEANYPFIPPKATDLRSPCPALNVLANHGVLLRDGRNIDLQMFKDAANLGFAIVPAAVEVIGIPSILTSTTGNASTVHLSDMAARHYPLIVDHDASASRQDAYFGEANNLNWAQWNRTLGIWGDEEIITMRMAAEDLKARFAWSAANNPEFNATHARMPCLLQYGLMLSTFGNIVTGDGNKTMIRYFVEEERFPFHMGWTPCNSGACGLQFSTNSLLAGNISLIWDRLR
ncbi:hypothetical protein HYALB_00002244 [Hymenoscyphus albidus]|uniref:Heme haloperoxidase family profile domain-containing protein n=1 Tax=Hymenoscyphus albidus TaxID=595503 RepID=A0A9N9PSM3_9HELO|nr:hypothetical protein HYALB_00002244 [Hymenoscyphus albidus]